MSEGFLRRWAARKAQTEQALPPVVPTPTPLHEIEVLAAVDDSNSVGEVPTTALEPVLPTLEDVRELTCSSDFVPFMREGVAPATRNAALKTLFTDPQFNVMDMMDIYVDDYSKPDPMTPAFLKLLNQAADLGLFATEPDDKEQDLPKQLADEVALPKSEQ